MGLEESQMRKSECARVVSWLLDDEDSKATRYTAPQSRT